MNKNRISSGKAANVVAANDLAIGNGNKVTVTGNTTINGIRILNWQAGSEIDIIFTGTPTIKHNTAASAGYASLQLAGGVDFIAVADDMLTLWYDGTFWQEKCRRSIIKGFAIKSSSATGGIGYSTGAGGAVTQATSIVTGVTLNAVCGTITTVSAALLTVTNATFGLTNSTIAATDSVVVSVKSYGGTAGGIPVAFVTATAEGSCAITIRNIGATTLDAVVVLTFSVVKAVAA